MVPHGVRPCLRQRARPHRRRCSPTCSENLAGIRVITATNRRRHNRINHDNLVGEHFEANAETARVGAIYGPTVEALGIVAQGILLAVGGTMVLNDQLTLGELTAFILYLNAFFAPIQQLVQLYNQYQQGQAAMTKLRGLLAEAPSVPSAPTRSPCPSCAGRSASTACTFGYEPDVRSSPTPTCRIAPGRDLRPRRPDRRRQDHHGQAGRPASTTPRAGAVTVDGHDLRDVTKASLRSQLGIVPQEPFLFAGHDPRQPHLRPTRRHRRRDRRGVRAVGPDRPARTPARRARHAWSTSGAHRCRPANASCWPWPGRSWPGPACWCWTRPPRTWT